MTYQAIVCKIEDIRPHPNADRLNLASAAGHQIIIDKNTEEDTLGLFFDSDGQLSEEFCYNNNLYRHTELNKDPNTRGGFFEDNRRVRAIQLRGAISEGFWCPIESLAYTKANLSKLVPGQLIDKINGHNICNKYYTPATQKALQGHKKTKVSQLVQIKEKVSQFKEHWDTGQLKQNIKNIPVGSILYISAKCHGTSGRSSNLPIDRVYPLPKIQWDLFKQKQKTFRRRLIHLWHLVFSIFYILVYRIKFAILKRLPLPTKYKDVCGTRRTVIDTKQLIEKGFYSGKKFRITAHNSLKVGLRKGETIYYELVGYSEDGKPIMPAHDISKTPLLKDYSSLENPMFYSYGCAPGQCDLYVYRVTHTSPDGYIIELPWPQVERRAKELGLKTVPLLDVSIYDGNQVSLLAKCEGLSEDLDPIDPRHIIEGIVLRVEAPNGRVDTYKLKNYWFRYLEGLIKDQDDYVDIEESS